MSYSHGSVFRLYLKNFMQYVEVEVCPGPSLNVILGPNGSGKSALVNALALALGAKPSVLGRADNVSEFIRYGAESAETEIELFNAEEESRGNYVIHRVWSRDKKPCQWRVNGRKSSAKDVTTLVQSLNIQTDNLCQFLPQDKVYDFSRMNPKELLIKTVAAFGEPELKSDHEKLIYFVKSLSDKEDELQVCQMTANEQRKRYEELELIVKTFSDKEDLSRRVRLLQQKKEWAIVAELKQQFEKFEKIVDRRSEKVEGSQEILHKIHKEIQTAKKTRQTIDNKIQSQIVKSRDCYINVRNKGQTITGVGDTIDNLTDSFTQRLLQEEDKETQVKKLETDMETLRKEIEAITDSASLEQRANEIKPEMNSLYSEKENYKQEISSTNHERLAIEAELNRLKETKGRLMDLDHHKKETMRKNLPQGKDVCLAMDWIEKNLDKFVGKVYMPILLQINVLSPENAKYVEANIPVRDLVAFGAENTADAELLIRQCRTVMKLNFNLVMYKQNPNLEKFKTGVNKSSRFNPSLEFKGFISDMFDAPPPIKAYLCELYHLHEAPVFGKAAQSQVKQLVEQQRLRQFIIEDWVHRVTISGYTKRPLTTSKQIETRNLLSISIDKNQLMGVERDIENGQQKVAELLNQTKILNASMKVCDQNIEVISKELKDLHHRIKHKQTLRGRLSAKEEQKEKLERQMRPEEIEKARRKMKLDQRRLLAETIELIAEVTDLTIQGNNLKLNSDLEKIKLHQATEELEALKVKQTTQEGKIEDLQIELGEAQETLKRSKSDYNRRLETAQALMGRNFTASVPPPKLLKAFEEDGISDIGSDEANIRIIELEAQMENLDDVNPEVFNEFKDLKLKLGQVKETSERCELEAAEKRDTIEKTKRRWLNRLDGLMTQVDDKFKSFFASMGYAGEINLNRGNFENDFANYGIEILVKFRENMPLQKLDPFRQSGGERSVSTALYMMALQSLTKVPFRCVDEINQGMDAVNERKVFDMLMSTAVKDQTAQYFLLTPKLLPNLSYEDGVTVLIVHHGDNMCSHKEWDMDSFIAASARA